MFPDWMKEGVKVVSIWQLKTYTLVEFDKKNKRWVMVDSDGKIGHILPIDAQHYREKM